MSKTFYFMDERYTLASALRCALEENSTTNDIVSCTLMHPLDHFIQVQVPIEGGTELLRQSLLSLKTTVHKTRLQIQLADK